MLAAKRKNGAARAKNKDLIFALEGPVKESGGTKNREKKKESVVEAAVKSAFAGSTDLVVSVHVTVGISCSPYILHVVAE